MAFPLVLLVQAQAKRAYHGYKLALVPLSNIIEKSPYKPAAFHIRSVDYVW